MFIEHKILKKAKKPEKKLQDVKTKRQEGNFVKAKVKMLHCLQRQKAVSKTARESVTMFKCIQSCKNDTEYAKYNEIFNTNYDRFCKADKRIRIALKYTE